MDKNNHITTLKWSVKSRNSVNCVLNIHSLTEKNLTSPNCGAKDEIISSLNRRIILPFYIKQAALSWYQAENPRIIIEKPKIMYK